MAKITYTQGGSDPATITWPPGGPPQFSFTSGTAINIPQLIFYPGNGMITFADGREFPRTSPQGSTFIAKV